MKKLFTNYRPMKALALLAALMSSFGVFAQQSVARQWNEVLLEAIRSDAARPTVHAHNLYHISAAMYDAWAVYDSHAEPCFLGKTWGGYNIPFNGVPQPENIQVAQEIAISYAAYRIIAHRFQLSPGVINTYMNINTLMANLELNPAITSINYADGDPAKLGNYIAYQMIQFGLQDGSNEAANYANDFYTPVNPDLDVHNAAMTGIVDPNRWQRMAIANFVDQSGVAFNSSPPFLSAEWGEVVPFSLQPDQVTVHVRDGNVFPVYMDAGDPPYLDTENVTGWENIYKWGFQMVSIWQSHLDPEDETMWDISPGANGNTSWLPEPQNFDEYPLYYKTFEGGTNFAEGHPVNPVTGEPYAPNLVKRADYARVLAEFWADGPHSETPPGHWFTILNYVADHPQFEKKWQGQGDVLSDLEWDARVYLALGGAMHDAAIACWSNKGWYDYIRPVSAIRVMAEYGQASDPLLPHFDPKGMVLVDGHVELVMPGDPLEGENQEHLYKIKLHTWVGGDPINVPDPLVDYAGVDWILAEKWFPYQRPSFVTPPFAGYMSGHSTYSRTAAELTELITGSAYFPGGMGVFVAEQNEYLVFEEGPTETVNLQWATYKDASDQCSLSRIWGGIHPPADDIPGRYIGMELGPQVFDFVNDMLANAAPKVSSIAFSSPVLNDASANAGVFGITVIYNQPMNTNSAPTIEFPGSPLASQSLGAMPGLWLDDQTYQANFAAYDMDVTFMIDQVKVTNATGENGKTQLAWIDGGFLVDTKNPTVTDANATDLVLTDADDTITVNLTFDETMDTNLFPTVLFPGGGNAGTLQFNPALSSWEGNVCVKVFDVNDNNVEAQEVFIAFEMGQDGNTNIQVPYTHYEAFTIDTRNPLVSGLTANDYMLTTENTGQDGFVVIAIFDEPMNTAVAPALSFSEAGVSDVLTLNATSGWLNDFTYVAHYDVEESPVIYTDITVTVTEAQDALGNVTAAVDTPAFFSIDMVTSVDELAESGNLIVFPNPVKKGRDITMTWPAGLDAHTVFVSNPLGQKVFMKSLADVAGYTMNIPTATFSSGQYFVGVVTPTGHLTTLVEIVK